MQYLLRLSDSASERMMVLTLDESLAKQAAIDLVFDLLGAENTEELVRAGIIADGQIDDLKEFRQIIFDRDEQGPFIREGVSFSVNGRELNPDRPLSDSFVKAERDGLQYMRLDLVVEPILSQPPNNASGKSAQMDFSPASSNEKSIEEKVQDFARIFFLHQIAVGFAIDVTREFPELVDIIKFAESKGWIEIDVKKVQYKLTAEGQKVYDQFIQEAQDLIRRFDIYADVDVDSSGKARFDTGLGTDLRVPAFEMEGVDPFRARFLLGINDGEWDQLNNWIEVFQNPDWYAGIFEPIERAPSIEELGRERVAGIVEQAKAALRQDPSFNS